MSVNDNEDIPQEFMEILQDSPPNPEFAKSNEEARKRQEEEIALMNLRRKRNTGLTAEEVAQYDLELQRAMERISVQPFFQGLGFVDDFMKTVKTGFDVADKLFTAGNLIDGNQTWKNLIEKLTYIFDWGKAIYGILEFFTGSGGSGEASGIQKELDAIASRLEDIEETIKQGFKNLIAHSDTAYFREKIGTPAQVLFDRLQRCNRTVTETNTRDFLDDCARTPPGHLLTAIFKFLDSPGDGLWTQLVANKYGYDTFEQWSTMINHTAVQLTIVNMFYYGLRLAHEKKTNSEKDRFQEGEKNEMVFQLDRIQKQITRTEWDRVKTFNSSEYGKKVLKDITANAVKQVDNKISQDQMDNLVKKVSEEWEKANGKLVPFTLIVWRGRMRKKEFGNKKGHFKFAQYSLHGTGVMILEDLYNPERQEENHGKWERWENLNLALIQPVTESMVNFQNNAAQEREMTEDVLDEISRVFFMWTPWPPSQRLELPPAALLKWELIDKFMTEELKKLKRKPLLVLYNNKVASERNEQNGRCVIYDTNGQDALGGTTDFKLIPSKFTFTKPFHFSNFASGAWWMQCFIYIFYSDEE